MAEFLLTVGAATLATLCTGGRTSTRDGVGETTSAGHSIDHEKTTKHLNAGMNRSTLHVLMQHW